MFMWKLYIVLKLFKAWVGAEEGINKTQILYKQEGNNMTQSVKTVKT